MEDIQYDVIEGGGSDIEESDAVDAEVDEEAVGEGQASSDDGVTCAYTDELRHGDMSAAGEGTVLPVEGVAIAMGAVLVAVPLGEEGFSVDLVYGAVLRVGHVFAMEGDVGDGGDDVVMDGLVLVFQGRVLHGVGEATVEDPVPVVVDDGDALELVPEAVDREVDEDDAVDPVLVLQGTVLL